MALEPCRECGAQISTEANVCPRCGVRSPTGKPGNGFKVVIGIIVLLVLIAISSHNQNGTTRRNGTTLRTADIHKNATGEIGGKDVEIANLTWPPMVTSPAECGQRAMSAARRLNLRNFAPISGQPNSFTLDVGTSDVQVSFHCDYKAGSIEIEVMTFNESSYRTNAKIHFLDPLKGDLLYYGIVGPLEASITVTTDGPPDSPAIVGTTNLPDGTELFLTIRKSPENYPVAGDQVFVHGGQFKTVIAYPLGTGTYSVEVLMPMSFTQPESVRAIIGYAGENLSGPLVEKDPRYVGNVTVHFQTTFTVPAKPFQR